MSDAPGLVVQGLNKRYGGVHAVKDLDFSVRPGECVALIGPNGAGKSTTFACIAGQQMPNAGEIVWNGQRLDTLTPARRLQRGVARTFQVAQVFDALTVLHNVQLLLHGAMAMNPLRRLDDLPTDTALGLLQRVGLEALAQSDAGSLAYGAKKRLELAMALAGIAAQRGDAENPALLLLDEPAAGLGAMERAALMQLVHSLTRNAVGTRPMAVLYTEHNMDAVFGVADRVLVIMEGSLVASGTANEVAAHALVRSRYLGQSLAHALKAGHA